MLLALSLDVGELERDPIVGEIIDSAIEVHRVLGSGLLESAYAHCLSHELIEKGIEIEREVPLPQMQEHWARLRLSIGWSPAM